MHFLMAKLHVIIEPGGEPVLLSVQSMQQCQPIVDIQENNLINIQEGSCLMEPKFKNKLLENTCNTFHLQHLKQIKVIKRRKKKGGDKVDLTIKNVIFWNSTLVTYTYI